MARAPSACAPGGAFKLRYRCSGEAGTDCLQSGPRLLSPTGRAAPGITSKLRERLSSADPKTRTLHCGVEDLATGLLARRSGSAPSSCASCCRCGVASALSLPKACSAAKPDLDPTAAAEALSKELVRGIEPFVDALLGEGTLGPCATPRRGLSTREPSKRLEATSWLLRLTLGDVGLEPALAAEPNSRALSGGPFEKARAGSPLAL